MSGTDDLRDLVAISQFAGRDLLLAQGAGGNTSVKANEGSRLLIKASGFRLDDISQTTGYLDLDLGALRQIFEEPALSSLPPHIAQDRTVQRVQALNSTPGAPRPSMETGFHLLLERVVLHTHPVYLNAFTCSEEGREAFDQAFDEPVAWVPYAVPGYPLATVVAESCAEYSAEHGSLPSRIVLENHGLITTSQTAAQAMDDTRALVRCAQHYFGAVPAAACEKGEPSQQATHWAERLAKIFVERGHPAIARPAQFNGLLAAARLPQELTAGPLVPDDAVYGVHNFWQLEARASASEWVDECRGELPAKAVLALAGEGVVLVGPNPKTLQLMEENLLANVLLHHLIRRRGTPRYLRSAEVDELLGMESEQYRQALARRAIEGEPECKS